MLSVNVHVYVYVYVYVCICICICVCVLMILISIIISAMFVSFLLRDLVALKRAVCRRSGYRCLLSSGLLGLLGEENGLDVGQNTTLGDGDTGQQFVQLLVVPDSQLEMTWDDSCLLVVSSGVTCQLENFGGEVFKYGGQVDRGASTDTLGIVSFTEQTMDTSDWELKSSTG